MKKIGVEGLVSSNDLANSTVLPSMYLGPSFSSINAAIDRVSHSVGSQCSQHAQTLYRRFIFPFLREFLSLGTLAFY